MSYDIYSNHADVIEVTRSTYESATLSESDRKWADEMIESGSRVKYYDLSPEQCEILNEWTMENYVQGVAKFTFNYAKDRVGLVVCSKEGAPVLDPDTGEPKTDEDGNPVTTTIIPDHDFGCTVKAEGLTDTNGTTIPSGYQYFKVINQSGNRPRTESNFKGLMNRLLKWMLNGEQLIKDATGQGITEQHRCIARCLLSLMGVKSPGSKEAEIISPDWGPLVFFTDGIHQVAAITADTGKSNSGKDIFPSDPQLLPVDYLQTPESITGHTPEPVYLTDRVGERTKALGKCESAVKMVVARMGGKNVNANIGNANESTELAHYAISNYLPDMDILAGYCHVLACPRFEKSTVAGKTTKVQPVSPNDMAAALALYSMRDVEPVDVFGTGRRGTRPLDDVDPIRIDSQQFLPLLEDIFNSSGTEASPVKDWLQARASGRYSTAKADKFAQLLRMVVAYFSPEEEVTADLLVKKNWTPNNGTSKGFYTVGGADLGAVPKKTKKDTSEEDEA